MINLFKELSRKLTEIFLMLLCGKCYLMDFKLRADMSTKGISFGERKHFI